jgi:hypothetical protein
MGPTQFTPTQFTPAQFTPAQFTPAQFTPTQGGTTNSDSTRPLFTLPPTRPTLTSAAPRMPPVFARNNITVDIDEDAPPQVCTS